MGILSTILGVLLVISGFVSLFHPFSSAIGLGMFLGILIGVLLIVGGFNGLLSIRRTGKSVWKIIFNMLLVILGILIICSDTGLWETSKVFIIIMAILMLLAGICRIIMAMELKKAGAPTNWVMTSGIITVIAAIVVLCFPLFGLVFFNAMLSIIVIVMGFSLITLGNI